jgi:hypothetical protein
VRPARLVPLLALSAACGGASFDGRVYRASDLAFRLGPVPESWRSLSVEGGARVAFRDDTARATVMVNGRCGLDGDDVPLRSLVQHLFLHFTERRVAREASRRIDGREALETELSAALDGVSKHYLVVVLKKDGCVYDLVRVGDGAPSPRAREDFTRFVAGFTTLEVER